MGSRGKHRANQPQGVLTFRKFQRLGDMSPINSILYSPPHPMCLSLMGSVACVNLLRILSGQDSKPDRPTTYINFDPKLKPYYSNVHPNIKCSFIERVLRLISSLSSSPCPCRALACQQLPCTPRS